MSLLEEPEPSPSGGSRWVALILVLGVAAGGAYFLMTPMTDEPVAEVRNEPETRAIEAPAAPAPSPDPVESEIERPAEPAPAVAEAPPPAAPSPSVVRLRVTSDVPGADVFIDRQYAGKTPFESTDISAGPHRVTVSAPGYDGVNEDVEIGDSVTELDLKFLDVRLDETVAVVHKHRFGDCSGRLVADLDGIHYRTDDDDAFSVGFDDLEEFTVDYLEHNLRLKVRGGRTYNFTDEETNADRLFVFHREVEEARTRMSAGS